MSEVRLVLGPVVPEKPIPGWAWCPRCNHPHLDYLNEEDCVSCGCQFIEDIAEMPDFRAEALTTPESLEQARSVTRGKVFFGRNEGQGGLETVSCREHGAILCVAVNETGKIWRCPACNEGAFWPVS